MKNEYFKLSDQCLWEMKVKLEHISDSEGALSFFRTPFSI
jgi:hypothetical protein